jgi:hypothetical protein
VASGAGSSRLPARLARAPHGAPGRVGPPRPPGPGTIGYGRGASPLGARWAAGEPVSRAPGQRRRQAPLPIAGRASHLESGRPHEGRSAEAVSHRQRRLAHPEPEGHGPLRRTVEVAPRPGHEPAEARPRVLPLGHLLGGRHAPVAHRQVTLVRGHWCALPSVPVGTPLSHPGHCCHRLRPGSFVPHLSSGSYGAPGASFRNAARKRPP